MKHIGKCPHWSIWINIEKSNDVFPRLPCHQGKQRTINIGGPVTHLPFCLRHFVTLLLNFKWDTEWFQKGPRMAVMQSPCHPPVFCHPSTVSSQWTLQMPFYPHPKQINSISPWPQLQVSNIGKLELQKNIAKCNTHTKLKEAASLFTVADKLKREEYSVNQENWLNWTLFQSMAYC